MLTINIFASLIFIGLYASQNQEQDLQNFPFNDLAGEMQFKIAFSDNDALTSALSLLDKRIHELICGQWIENKWKTQGLLIYRDEEYKTYVGSDDIEKFFLQKTGKNPYDLKSEDLNKLSKQQKKLLYRFCVSSSIPMSTIMNTLIEEKTIFNFLGCTIKRIQADINMILFDIIKLTLKNEKCVFIWTPTSQVVDYSLVNDKNFFKYQHSHPCIYFFKHHTKSHNLENPISTTFFKVIKGIKKTIGRQIIKFMDFDYKTMEIGGSMAYNDSLSTFDLLSDPVIFALNKNQRKLSLFALYYPFASRFFSDNFKNLQKNYLIKLKNKDSNFRRIRSVIEADISFLCDNPGSDLSDRNCHSLLKLVLYYKIIQNNGVQEKSQYFDSIKGWVHSKITLQLTDTIFSESDSKNFWLAYSIYTESRKLMDDVD